MAEAYALLTHSLSPPANRWCFQIGTVALSSSISARQASKASAGDRWTRPPRRRGRRSPGRRSGARPRSRAPDGWQRSSRRPCAARRPRRVRGVGQAGDSAPVVVIADRAGEQRRRAGPLITGRGGTSSTDSGLSRTSASLITFTCQVTFSWAPGRQAAGRVPLRRARGHDPLRRRRTWRTIAAVPITATVAPAAVIVASFFASRRPATAWWPALSASRTSSASRCHGRPPARLAQRLAVDHPRVDDVVQVGDRRRGDAGPVQPLRGGERHPGRQLDPAQSGQLLDLLLLEPAVAADRERAGHPAAGRQLDRRHQVDRRGRTASAARSP